MRRLGIMIPAAVLGLLLTAAPALACGGLIGPNGAVNLLRTTTFAGYHDGQEHYVTAFQFAGGGGAFGSITPLPGIPIERREGRRLDAPAARSARRTRRSALPSTPPRRVRRPRGAEELMKVKIDALDITVLRGGVEGHRRVGQGSRLPPPARRARGPRLLRAAAARSSSPPRSTPTPPRSAASRSATGRRSTSRSRPTSPWVPLRILALGKTGAGADRRRRLPHDRPAPGAAADADRRQRHPPRLQRAGRRHRSCPTCAATAAWSGSRRRRG